MAPEPDDGVLFDLNRFRVPPRPDVSYEEAVKRGTDECEMLIRARAAGIAQERGEPMPTERMAEDATRQVLLGIANRTRGAAGVGGVLLGGALSGLATILAGNTALPLTVGTVACAGVGAALMSNPSGGATFASRVRLAVSPQRRRRARLALPVAVTSDR